MNKCLHKSLPQGNKCVGLREILFIFESEKKYPGKHFIRFMNVEYDLNLRKSFYRILKAAGIEQKGLHSLRHTFATNLVNGQKQPDGTIKALSPRQVADLLGHSTSQITELYYVKKDTARLSGITEGFEM